MNPEPILTISYPENLPVSGRVADIKAALAQHQVLIVAGETGSGKTTQLPKICLELGRGRKGMIGHTQPRRLAARTVSTRIADELGVPQGSVVGFQVRFSDTSSEQTLVKVMTDGILLAETRNDPQLRRYDTIIIDEAHERSLNIDFLLGYLKRLLPKRPDLKVIITSATIDVEKFSAHFNHAPVIEVSGRSYPVDTLYRPPTEAEGEPELGEQVLAAFEEIRQREKQTRPAYRDVLVFLSGEREIRETAEVLRKQNIPDLEVLPLYARLSNKEQQRVFSPHAGRRIVLTTNVAETSLTVPGIGYVIDSGTARISRYSVRSKIQRLPVEAISQASANQRAGRCGRLCPGVCIRLYSEEDFRNRPAFTDTEITRTNLASVILQMLSLRLGDIERFPFLEAPESRAVRDGFKLLEELQAVDDKNRLTPYGQQMARLPLDPRLARVLVEATQRSCLREILIIVSALGTQDPRERPLDKQQAADEAHKRFFHPESDFCTWLNLWDFYETQRQELTSNALRKFCQQNFLSHMRMREWREVHRQLLLQCQEMKLALNQQPATYEEIHQALLSGFLSQVANRLEDGSYLGARSRKYVMFRGSTLNKKGCKWIVSAELVETSQLFARMNARVDPEWIERQGSHLLKHDHFEPHWERKRGQVLGFEKVSLYGLVLVEKRRIAYARVDPVLSRDLFIREGLCALEVNTRAAFYQHNKAVMERILDLEERSRRRDLLVDEETIRAFYDARLPAEVVDVTSLERWYSQLGKAEAHKLWLQESDLVTASADAIDPSQFPQQIKLGEMKLPLDYVFDPGKDSDGISVEVPVTALKQLKDEDLDWLVPGLLREKCVALIRALPKQLRKNFVPIPDIVEKVLPRLKREDGSLQAALARQLLRETLVAVPLDAWEGEKLPDHLQMNIKVLDEQGKVLGSGRDLQQLKVNLGSLVQAGISKAGQNSMERKGLTSWDFGELPEASSVQVDKLRIQAYPALVDRGESVDLALLDSPYRALLSTRAGVTRLLMLASKQQHRYLQKQLLQNPAHMAAWRSLAPREQVLDQLIMRAYAIAFKVEESVPRSQQAFEAMLARGRAEVPGVATALEDLLCRILTLRASLQQRLQRGFKGLGELQLKEDVEAQLAHLFPADFLAITPWLQLQQFPRYLQAIEARLDKYSMQGAKDAEWTRLLSRLWKQYAERKAYSERHEQVDAALDEYRWLLEELRVSLFAQALGTRVPVSEKRLQKFWLEQVVG
jgi:ATP-dependent helicase HrpA